MMPALSWIADAVLVLLLTGTLCMAVRLDRALRVIRRDRGAFETLIANLGLATSAVKLGIEALRGEAERAAEQIERRSEDADKMATDLSFLIEAAERAGLNLEQRLKPGAQPASEPVQLSSFAYNASVQKASVQKTGAKSKPASRKPRPSSGQTAEIVVTEIAVTEIAAPETVAPVAGPAGDIAASSPRNVMESEPVSPVAVPAAPAGDLRELAGITTKRSARPGTELADKLKAGPAASAFRYDAAIKKAG